MKNKLQIYIMIQLFKNAELKYLNWLKSNPNGFVLNCCNVEDEIFVRDYFILHKSTCYTISSQAGRYKFGGYTERNYMKYCSMNKMDLIEKMKDFLKPEHKNVRFCKICNPEKNAKANI